MFVNRFLIVLAILALLPSFATPVMGQKKKVIVSAPPVAPTAKWQSASQENVAYGIKMDTFEASDAAPRIRIYGSKGEWTNPMFLDNGKANYKGGEDYFFLTGSDFENNVGIPLRVEFEAGGDDAHGFELKSVDYFAIAGWDMRKVKTEVEDFNNRNEVLNSLQGFLRLKDTLVAQVVFEKSLHLAVTDRKHANLWYSKGPHYLDASKLLKDSAGKELEMNVSKMFVVVDARSANSPITYNSGEDSTVSQEELRRAINSKMSQTSSSDSTTVGVKLEKEGTAPLIGKMKAELSFSHTHTDSSSESNSSSNENQNGRKGSHTSSTGIGYQVNMGDVTFFEVTKTATVKLLGAIPELTTISPQVKIETSIRPTTFRTNLETGELCRLNYVSESTGSFVGGNRKHIFQLGGELKNESELLNIAEKAWGTGPNGFSTYTEISPAIKAKFGKSGK